MPSAILPSGYIPVLFLESNTRPYIDTTVTLNGSSVVNITHQHVLGSTTQECGCIFGARESSTLRCFTYYDRAAYGNAYFGYNNQSVLVFPCEYTNPITKVTINGPSWHVENIDREFSRVFNHGDFETYTAYLFTYHDSGGADSRGYLGRIYNCSIGTPTKKQRDFVPALDNNGKPCMFDKVTQKAHYNANTSGNDFIVGLTIEQARKLSNLPETTDKTLYISLPSSVFDENGNIIDETINNALEITKSKNWNFIIKNYTE